jgi:aldose 1-epimerase
MLTIQSGASSVVVAPEHGAALVSWMIGTTPILRRAPPQAAVAGDPHAMGCFPLLPYCNRVGHGRFHWRGTDYQLKRNLGDHPHSIHGVGWQRAWTVMEAGPCSITMQLEHSPDDAWPFAFAATVGYQLTGTALTIAIRLTNRHDGPTPAGIGIHPFFPKAHDPTLRFKATGAWEDGSDALPSRHGPVPPDWIHISPRRVADSRLDHCFTGWDGTADTEAGPASLRIEASEAFRQLQVFTPSWADFFCAEPVSHIPDAVNRPDLPPDQAMHVLEPGETLGGTIRWIPSGQVDSDRG